MNTFQLYVPSGRAQLKVKCQDRPVGPKAAAKANMLVISLLKMDKVEMLVSSL